VPEFPDHYHDDPRHCCPLGQCQNDPPVKDLEPRTSQPQTNTKQFQHFVEEIREDFWGDLYQKGQEALKKFFESDSERQRDRYLGWEWYQRSSEPERDYRYGYYERDYVTRFGTLRIRIARTRGRAFLPRGLKQFQRRADEVALLIREAFLRGISTRQVGQVLAVITGEVVSAQTVSNVTQSLDQLVKQFQQARLKDEWKYLFLEGVSLRDLYAECRAIVLHSWY
jgi:putative transposase